MGRPAEDIGQSVPYAALMRRISCGNQEAYEQLYRRTRGLVFQQVLVVVRDRGYAEETCHDVYLEVWRSAGGFDERRGSVLTWLRMLAHRKAVDRVRREQAVADHNRVWMTRDYHPAFDMVAEDTVRHSEERAVRKSLNALTPRQRESVVLAYYAGLTYPQVAAHLGIGVPTVKSRIRAGLAQLRSALPEHY